MCIYAEIVLLTQGHYLDCLQKNNYKEEKCKSAVDALYECCNAFYQDKGDDATTTSCPKPKLLRLKLEQRGQK